MNRRDIILWTQLKPLVYFLFKASDSPLHFGGRIFDVHKKYPGLGPGPAPGPPGAAPAAEPTTEPVFEPAENGYFFRKMPDGSYDQTVYVQAEDGSYVPYQA